MAVKKSFSVNELLESNQLTIYEKDILKALNESGKLTVNEAKKKINQFLKRKVK
ncbi:hypothetical protein PV797_07165 [Clostridiaceae bacterium M8S5]|nr:hypothetical protein PV797_07165 [Clostridiaceae bacterium M8S5]